MPAAAPDGQFFVDLIKRLFGVIRDKARRETRLEPRSFVHNQVHHFICVGPQQAGWRPGRGNAGAFIVVYLYPAEARDLFLGLRLSHPEPAGYAPAS